MRFASLPHRARSANTLVELILYMALTLIIIVGLTNIVSRLKQAELSGTVKTDVQQSVRATIQQFSGLAQLYESGAIIKADHLPAGNGETGSGVLLWNAVHNQNLEPGELPRNYLRFWLSDGVVYTQSYANNQGQSTAVPITPEGILVSTLEFQDVSGDSDDAVLSIHIVAEDNSPSENVRDQFQWNITSAVTLRPRNKLADFCCPNYLNFCPVGFPLCENNGCFAIGQSGSDLLGQFSIVNNDVVLNFSSAVSYNNKGMINSGGFLITRDIAIDTENHRLFLTDAFPHRVLQFDLTEDNLIENYAATAVFGQPNMTTAGVLFPAPPTTDSNIRAPEGIEYNRETNYLFVASVVQHRIVGYDLSDQGADLGKADIVLGQTSLTANANSPVSATSLNSPQTIVFDYPHKRAFVADKANNRVLGYKLTDQYEFQSSTGDAAEFVLGQTSFSTTTTTYLNSPFGLAISPTHLFVSDGTTSSPKRVLAFNLETLQEGAVLNTHQYVITSNTNTNPVANQSNINAAGPLTFDPVNQRLFVGDPSSGSFPSRVLTFSGSATQLTDNMSALYSLGENSFQPPYDSVSINRRSLGNITGLEYDVSKHRLYVSDGFRNRVMIFDAGGPECNNAEYFEPPAGAQMSVASSSSSAPGTATLSCDQECTETDWDDCVLYKTIDDDFTPVGTGQNQTYESNTDDFIQACDDSSGYFELGNTPVDFDIASRILLRVHYRLNEGLSTDYNPTGFSIGLYKNDSPNPLAISPPTVLSSSIDTQWRYWQTELPFTGADNNKTTWDDALIKIQNLNLGGLPSVKISAVEVIVEYEEGNATVTLKPVGDRAGNLWTRIGDLAPFSPNLYSGLLLWLDGDTGTLKTGGSAAANGEAVEVWQDQKSTGTAYNMTQATGTKQPTLVTGGANGHNVLQFDGTDDMMSTPQMVNAFSGGYTAFYVMSFTDGRPSTTLRPYGGLDTITSYFDTFLQTSGVLSYITRYGAGSSPVSHTRAFNSTSPVHRFPDGQTPFYLLGSIAGPRGATTVPWNTYLNGTPLTSTPAEPTLAMWDSIKTSVSEVQNIGSAFPGGGSNTPIKVAEIIIYKRALTTTERCIVQNQLKLKYNLSSPAFPASCP